MPTSTPVPAIVLASSSPYRRELLQRLRLEFSCQSPDIDESARTEEMPIQLVQRLALEKARVVAAAYESPALVIGSDQVAVLEDQVLGKPGNAERAVEQLRMMRGCRIEFLTALALVNTESQGYRVELVPFTVKFRDYSDAEIERYVAAEQPYNCAGSFRSEAYGATLVETMTGSDPTALVGLPLIRLCDMLRQEGIALP